jgi:hypothetical protein
MIPYQDTRNRPHHAVRGMPVSATVAVITTIPGGIVCRYDPLGYFNSTILRHITKEEP